MLTSLRAHLSYGWYIARHKWYVLLECTKLGIVWRGLVHDLSKFRWREWWPYVDKFYGPKRPTAAETGRNITLGCGYNTIHEGDFLSVVTDTRTEVIHWRPSARCQEDVDYDFDVAWLHHQKSNPHHWQYWILIRDTGAEVILPMPEVYIREMVADWRGAGRAVEKPDTLAWYAANKDKMRLHPDTRKRVEQLLGG